MTGRNWPAALLSFVAPGLGQLDNGRVRRAALVFGAFILLLPVGWRLMLVLPCPFNLLAGSAWLAVLLLSAIDAALADSKKEDRSKSWSLPVVGLGAAMLVASLGWIWVVKEFDVQPTKIPTRAMQPTVLVGDHLAVDRAAYGLRNPFSGRWLWSRRQARRGDLAVFLFPGDRSRMFLMRIIGLPGETLEIQDGVVRVDGKALDEPYVQFLEPPTAVKDWGNQWGPETVPEGHLFVLGDNRQNSRDSRYWGFVPIEDVLGEAKVVYWSIDPYTHVPRWRRLGHRLH